MSNYASINGWRGHSFFLSKKIKLLDKYERWRKVAKILNLSKEAGNRLEWFIFYQTKAKENALLTCRHFGISAKTFYKWKKRFDPLNLRNLEDQSKAPINTRKWQITSLQQQRIIKLRKKYIRWGKEKIVQLYKDKYREEISSWKVQRVIEEYKLYFNPVKTARVRRKRQRSQKKKRLTDLKKKQYPGFIILFDTIEIHWNGLRRYIFTAIDYAAKTAFARMYTTKSSCNGRDFLERLYFLFDGKMYRAGHDNGSEFMKLFKDTCQSLKIPQYHTRPYTPKDNAVCEKFNQTLRQEFIELSNFTPNVVEFNKDLTEWLVLYNFKRPHQSLNYKTPIQYTQKRLKVLPMWSSSALFLTTGFFMIILY